MQDWSEYPTRSAVEEFSNDENFVLVDENGYGMLTVWAAGPARSFRTPAQLADFRPSRIRTSKDGSETIRLEPRTSQDQEIVDETINEFLGEAGIPAMPSGFHWYVSVPNHMTRDELAAHLSAANEFLDAPSVARRISELYEQVQQR